MNPAKQKSFADLLILSLFSAALFGFKLGERALWSPVEGHYSEIAREMAVSGDYLTPWLAGMKFLESRRFSIGWKAQILNCLVSMSGR